MKLPVITEAKLSESLKCDLAMKQRTVKERTLLFFNNIGKKRQVEYAKANLNETK